MMLPVSKMSDPVKKIVDDVTVFFNYFKNTGHACT